MVAKDCRCCEQGSESEPEVLGEHRSVVSSDVCGDSRESEPMRLVLGNRSKRPEVAENRPPTGYDEVLVLAAGGSGDSHFMKHVDPPDVPRTNECERRDRLAR